MTAWRLIPLNNGPHIRVRVFAGVDLAHVTEVGELMLRPAEYGDLAARIGNTDGFSTETGRPLAVVSVVNGYELLDETTRQLRAVEVEREELRERLGLCPDCGTADGTCRSCKICIPCSIDGHREGCPHEGDEYTDEQRREIEALNVYGQVKAGERTEDAPDGAP